MIAAFDDSLAAMGSSQYMVIFTLIWVLKLTTAAAATLSRSNTGLAEGGEQGDAGDARSRLRRHTCRETEYQDKDICCLKCPAGTHVQSSCTTTGEKGVCEDCDFGTYTEHENGLQRQCLKCTNCRSDQHVVRPCTSIQNTECQCKPGTFCAPDQACEICKKCSRCREGEVKVRNCTATANTVCKKTPSSPSTGSVAVIIISLALLVAVVLVVALVCLWKRRRHQTQTGSQSDRNDSLKVVVDKMTSAPSTEESQNRQNHAMTREDDRLCLLPQHCQRAVRAAGPTGKSSALEEDEDTGLGDSLANTASNSQSSLLSSQLPSAPAPPCSTSYYLPIYPPQPSYVVPRQLRDDDPIPSLIPLNGEESLKKCFEYFEDLDVDYHKRFFRHLGINDNLIKSKDHLHHEDRIHELLNVWMEKVGKDASLNHLLKALLTFNQRLTAENVIAKAVAGGYYERERE